MNASWRQAEPRLGKAWIATSDLKLRKGIEVKVESLSHGKMVAIVTASWGLEKRAYSHHLDFGIELLTHGGQWIHQSEQKAILWLQKAREELLRGVERHKDSYGHALTLERVEEALRREEKGRVRTGPPWRDSA